MNTPTRLGLYGLGLIVAFGGAFGLAGALVPESTVSGWSERVDSAEHGTTATSDAGQAEGYTLDRIGAPSGVGVPGVLSLGILDGSGRPVSATAERDLNLVILRGDGSAPLRVHPVPDPRTDTWATPWQWRAAGTYRIFAELAPGSGESSAVPASGTVNVAGDFTPETPAPRRSAEVDGYTVSLSGDLIAGSASTLTLSAERAGVPVAGLESAPSRPLALRLDTLTAVPAQSRDAAVLITAPAAGRYLISLEFRVDGHTHAAEFYLDAAPAHSAGH